MRQPFPVTAASGGRSIVVNRTSGTFKNMKRHLGKGIERVTHTHTHAPTHNLLSSAVVAVGKLSGKRHVELIIWDVTEATAGWWRLLKPGKSMDKLIQLCFQSQCLGVQWGVDQEAPVVDQPDVKAAFAHVSRVEDGRSSWSWQDTHLLTEAWKKDSQGHLYIPLTRARQQNGISEKNHFVLIWNYSIKLWTDSFFMQKWWISQRQQK